MSTLDLNIDNRALRLVTLCASSLDNVGFGLSRFNYRDEFGGK